jgi:hypothetical protein
MDGETAEAPVATGDRVPICADYDDDCAYVKCKLTCYLYDPAKGRCPYLSGENHG